MGKLEELRLEYREISDQVERLERERDVAWARLKDERLRDQADFIEYGPLGPHAGYHHDAGYEVAYLPVGRGTPDADSQCVNEPADDCQVSPEES